MERVVIVGASLAGLTAGETLREEGFDGEITLIGEEPETPYDRPPLSKQLLTGEWDVDRLALRSDDEFAQLGLEFLGGRVATGLDVGSRVVRLDQGEQIEFDGLIIATGARPLALPFGRDLEGVHTLRTRSRRTPNSGRA